MTTEEKAKYNPQDLLDKLIIRRDALEISIGNNQIKMSKDILRLAKLNDMIPRQIKYINKKAKHGN